MEGSCCSALIDPKILNSRNAVQVAFQNYQNGSISTTTGGVAVYVSAGKAATGPTLIQSTTVSYTAEAGIGTASAYILKVEAYTNQG